jgi:hypothetical protein
MRDTVTVTKRKQLYTDSRRTLHKDPPHNHRTGCACGKFGFDAIDPNTGLHIGNTSTDCVDLAHLGGTNKSSNSLFTVRGGKVARVSKMITHLMVLFCTHLRLMPIICTNLQTQPNNNLKFTQAMVGPLLQRPTPHAPLQNMPAHPGSALLAHLQTPSAHRQPG